MVLHEFDRAVFYTGMFVVRMENVGFWVLMFLLQVFFFMLVIKVEKREQLVLMQSNWCLWKIMG